MYNQLVEASNKNKNKIGGTSSYNHLLGNEVVNNFNDACFFRLRIQYPYYSGGIRYSIVYLPRVKEEHKEYCDFLVNESPYKDVFLNKDTYWKTKRLLLNSDMNHTLVLSAITAIRLAWEFPMSHESFVELGKHPLTKMERFVLAQRTGFKDGKFISASNGGHMIYPSDQSKKDLISLMNEEFPGWKNVDKAPMNKKATGWTIHAMHSTGREDYFRTLGKKRGNGWDSYHEYPLENLLKFVEESRNAK